MLLRAAFAFFVLALISFVVGANGMALLSAEVGKTLLWVFVAFAVVSWLAHLITGRGSNQISN